MSTSTAPGAGEPRTGGAAPWWPQSSASGPAEVTKIGAHRLWISVWIFLGRVGDNSGKTGDNHSGPAREAAALHTLSPAGPAHRTAPVDQKSRCHLRERLLSPGSTVPMTATFSCRSKTTTFLVAHGDQRSGPRAEGLGRAIRSRPGHTHPPGPAKPASRRPDRRPWRHTAGAAPRPCARLLPGAALSAWAVARECRPQGGGPGRTPITTEGAFR